MIETGKAEELQYINARITQNSETLINVALTNCPEKIINSGVVHVAISDHSLIYICRKISFVETQLKLIESDDINSYSIVSNDRNREGGGVAIY